MGTVFFAKVAPGLKWPFHFRYTMMNTPSPPIDQFALDHGMTEDEFEGLCDPDVMGFNVGGEFRPCQTCKNSRPFSGECMFCAPNRGMCNWEPATDLWDGLEDE